MKLPFAFSFSILLLSAQTAHCLLAQYQPPSGGALPAGVVITSRTVVSAAQLNSTTNAPVTIIPAPGAGKVIDPTGSYMFYNPGTTAFTAYGDCGLQFGFLGIVLSPLIGSNFGSLTSLTPLIGGQVLAAQVLGGQTSSYDNQPIVVNSVCGRVSGSSLAAGGTGFQAGDVFTVNNSGGAVFAAGVVDTAASGVVATYHLTSQGADYAVGPALTFVPDSISSTSNDRGLRTAVVNAPGSGYVTGDTVSADGCSASVLTVTATAGSVTALALTRVGGTCAAATGMTTTAISGMGTGLTVNTTALGGGLQINVNSIQGYSGGDGTLTVGVNYVVVGP
jgi:hypothetical protein